MSPSDSFFPPPTLRIQRNPSSKTNALDNSLLRSKSQPSAAESGASNTTRRRGKSVVEGRDHEVRRETNVIVDDIAQPRFMSHPYENANDPTSSSSSRPAGGNTSGPSRLDLNRLFSRSNTTTNNAAIEDGEQCDTTSEPTLLPSQRVWGGGKDIVRESLKEPPAPPYSEFGPGTLDEGPYMAQSSSSPANFNFFRKGNGTPTDIANMNGLLSPSSRSQNDIPLIHIDKNEGGESLPQSHVVFMDNNYADHDTYDDDNKDIDTTRDISDMAYDASFLPENPVPDNQHTSGSILGSIVPRITSLWPGSHQDESDSRHHADEQLRHQQSPHPQLAEYEVVGNSNGMSRSGSRNGAGTPNRKTPREEQHPAVLHSDEMVDYLDVLDPAVGFFNTLQDYGNSAMLPNLPWLYNRRPTLRLNQVVPQNEIQRLKEEQTPMSPDSFDLKRGNASTSFRPAAAAGDETLLQPPPLTLPPADPVETPSSQPQPHPSDAVVVNMPDEYVNERERANSDGTFGKWSTDRDSLSRKDTSETVEAVPSSGAGKGSMRTDAKENDDPHTERYWAMDKEEREELEAHVRYLLTRKSKTRRMLRGFVNFVCTPMGFILTTYIFLIFSWGVVIFLLIVNWVHVEPYHRRRVWIEVCDQVLCALFVLRGVGFMPFRMVDTYHMAHIAHLHFLTYRRRRLLHLPELQNKNELPRYTRDRLESVTGPNSAPERTPGSGRKRSRRTRSRDERDSEEAATANASKDMELQDPVRDLESIGVKNVDHVRTQPYHFEQLLRPLPGLPGSTHQTVEEIEKARLKRTPSIQSWVEKNTHEVSVLTPSEQAQLQHHQHCFHSSHTFYRYRETATHRPFPLWLMMTIVVLLDVYSFLQACLAGTTWGIRYEHRPTALTATIISCSLSCNAIAGILIWQGGKRTRKTEVVQRRVKLALEEQAIQRMDRKRRKAARLAESGLMSGQKDRRSTILDVGDMANCKIEAATSDVADVVQ